MSTTSELFNKSQLKSLHGGAPTPLYYQLYSLMKNAILTGAIGTGAQMPTEQQLSETFDVSRITAKRAMDELAKENLVARRRGKGTHVIHKYKPQPVKAPLVGMLQEIESMARHSDVKVLACSEQSPSAEIRKVMKLKANQNALHMLRVRSKDGQPFGYYQSWTQGLKTPVTDEQLVSIPRLEIFRDQGLNITHVTQTISAVAATAELARELGTSVGAPLISMIRQSFTDENPDAPSDYLQIYYHPDRFQYRMDLVLED